MHLCTCANTNLTGAVRRPEVCVGLSKSKFDSTQAEAATDWTQTGGPDTGCATPTGLYPAEVVPDGSPTTVAITGTA